MVQQASFFRSKVFLGIVLTFSVWFLVSCASLSSKPSDISPATQAEYEKLKRKYRKLQQTSRKRDADFKALEEKIAKLQLGFLERDAQTKQFNEQLVTQQMMLDDAIQEVVRTKAKLRSLESKAEAASNMAEAEIAVKALKAQSKAGEQGPEVIQAERLLEMSAREFKKENYGGALYLTSQAKSHIKRGRRRLIGEETIVPVEGEVIFAQSVPLQVLKKSNLREAPDLRGKVLTKLDRGASVIAYSYKGQWVRVTTVDGINGWIYQTLVGGR
jgi:hypothetical protein